MHSNNYFVYHTPSGHVDTTGNNTWRYPGRHCFRKTHPGGDVMYTSVCHNNFLNLHMVYSLIIFGIIEHCRWKRTVDSYFCNCNDHKAHPWRSKRVGHWTDLSPSLGRKFNRMVNHWTLELEQSTEVNQHETLSRRKSQIRSTVCVGHEMGTNYVNFCIHQ